MPHRGIFRFAVGGESAGGLARTRIRHRLIILNYLNTLPTNG
jgi:hypothetical protein